MSIKSWTRWGLSALVGVAAMNVNVSNAMADHGYGSYYRGGGYSYGHTAFRPNNCAPTYRYQPIGVPQYGYGYSGIGYGVGYPSYSSYRPIVPAYPVGIPTLGGYGVGGFPPGASWGGGSGRGFSLYIGR